MLLVDCCILALIVAYCLLLRDRLHSAQPTHSFHPNLGSSHKPLFLEYRMIFCATCLLVALWVESWNKLTPTIDRSIWFSPRAWHHIRHAATSSTTHPIIIQNKHTMPRIHGKIKETHAYGAEAHVGFLPLWSRASCSFQRHFRRLVVETVLDPHAHGHQAP